MDHDTLLRAQSQRLRRVPAAPPLPASRASAPAHDGDLLAVDGAAAVLETVTWPPEAFERVVLGDRTGYLHLAALPDPETAGAQPAVTELVAAAAARVAEGADGLRAQLFLRWPSADTAMHPLLQRAGLSVDALWSARSAQPLPGRPAPGIRVRRAEPSDAAQVGDLAVEELRFHLPLTPFTRDLPVVRPWMSAAVTQPDPALLVFVAEQERGDPGALIAYAVCRLVDTPDDGLNRPSAPGRAGHFLSVGVAAQARGSGVGSALVHTAAAALAGAGAGLLTAAFVPGNPLAAPFWTGRGFAPVWHYYAVII